MGKAKQGGLMKASVQQDREQIELMEKSAIENAIYEKNKQKFTQTNSTLAMNKPLVLEMEFLGDSIACKVILEGEYELLSYLDCYSKAYIKVLAKPTYTINTPQAVVPTETFKLDWFKIKKATLAGISSIYFSNMKAYS